MPAGGKVSAKRASPFGLMGSMCAERLHPTLEDLRIWTYGAGSAAPVVLLTHGYAEHCHRYIPLIEDLGAAGYTVVTYDQHGHGRSPGPRATVDVALLVEEHLLLRQRLERAYPGREIFLFGHSMGGLITAASALARPEGIAGVILSSPALQVLPRAVPRWVQKLVGLAARRFGAWPLVPFAPGKISRRPEVVDAYIHDPLNYTGRTPLLTGYSMYVQGRKVLREAPAWQVPTLLLHGDADELALPQGSRDFAQSTGVNVEWIAGAYHEILNEPEGPQVRKRILQWLQAQRAA